MAKQARSSKNQTFHIHAPAAQEVLLVGDFTDWRQRAISMRKGEDGIWSASVGLPHGTHLYRFIIDGQWCVDPECSVREPNVYRGQNMVRQGAVFGVLLLQHLSSVPSGPFRRLLRLLVAVNTPSGMDWSSQ